MKLDRLYSCPHCTKGYLENLEHWEGFFQCQDDDYADEIVQMFGEKIFEVKHVLASFTTTII